MADIPGMSSTPAIAARPGRRCVLCSHADRARIEAEIASGQISIRGVASRHGMVHESVRRHLSNHVSASLQAALGGVIGAPAVSMASRLLDVADSAQATRAAAEAAGDHKLAIAAGQAEARVLGLLLPLDALGEGVADSVQEAYDALQAFATTVRVHPEVGEIIASVLDGRGRTEWAERIRQLALTDSNSRNEVTR